MLNILAVWLIENPPGETEVRAGKEIATKAVSFRTINPADCRAGMDKLLKAGHPAISTAEQLTKLVAMAVVRFGEPSPRYSFPHDNKAGVFIVTKSGHPEQSNSPVTQFCKDGKAAFSMPLEAKTNAPPTVTNAGAEKVVIAGLENANIFPTSINAGRDTPVSCVHMLILNI